MDKWLNTLTSVWPFTKVHSRVSFRILAEGEQNQIKWNDGGAKNF